MRLRGVAPGAVAVAKGLPVVLVGVFWRGGGLAAGWEVVGV